MEGIKSVKKIPKAIADDLISVYEREYEELCGNWQKLEQKAQLTAGSSGLILTGSVAFLSLGLVDIPAYAYWFFPLIALTLFISGLCSLRALWVSGVDVPPAGEDLRSVAEGIQCDTDQEWVEEYWKKGSMQKLMDWDDACEDTSNSLHRKGRWVLRAQAWLLVTAGLVLIFVVTVSVVVSRQQRPDRFKPKVNGHSGV